MCSGFSCVVSRLERFSLNLPQAVKKRGCALEVGCGCVFGSSVREICSCRLI